MSADGKTQSTPHDGENWRDDPLENTPIVRRELPTQTTPDVGLVQRAVKAMAAFPLPSQSDTSDRIDALEAKLRESHP